MTPHDLPAGLYEALVTLGLDALLADPLADTRALDPAETPGVLARHIHGLVHRALLRVPGRGAEQQAAQVALANRVVAVLADQQLISRDTSVAAPHRKLLAFGPPAERPTVRPETPLGTSELFVNAREEVRIGAELRREIPSADRIDLICSFIKVKGLTLLQDRLRPWIAAGRRMRVLTTPYVGVTEESALTRLRDMGAEVRVSYDARRTRLHAKAWLFHRNTGFSTAYIGSSNLSHSALTDGVEWNVRLAQVDAPDVLQRFRQTFEAYWEDGDFEPYDPERFRRAKARARPDSSAPLTLVELHPYPFQQEVLDRLEVERRLHGRTRNLVVAATGTGKTVIAALDHARVRRERLAAGQGARLLFVAHRQEILSQSRDLFRLALKDRDFGGMLVGGERPEPDQSVFASIQSLARLLPPDGPAAFPEDAFDIVIIDEVHHGAAATYRRLLEHVQPALLVGLTATPERHDGQCILPFFDGQPAVELRLWDALERGLLCPFHYFGIHDGTDLRGLRFRRGFGYDTAELTALFSEQGAARARARLVLEELDDKVPDPRRMRALGFCVSVAHARFMAAQLREAGLRAVAVTGQTERDERARALRQLRDGVLQAIFTVDLFNEGVDLPEVDTLLMLRPTESATVFLQQLGRGLRLAEGKDAVTVLDFMGLMHSEYRAERKYRGLLRGVPGGLKKSVEDGFPVLPIGCAMRLDRKSEGQVLASVKRSLGGRHGPVVQWVKEAGPLSLRGLLRAFDWSLPELYRRRDHRWTWSGLQGAAGHRPALAPEHRAALRCLGGLLHLDDAHRLDTWRSWLAAPAPPVVDQLDPTALRLARMLHFAVFGVTKANAAPLCQSLDRLWGLGPLRHELHALLTELRDGLDHAAAPLGALPGLPLQVHGRYLRDEALAALDVLDPARPHSAQSGVVEARGLRALALFVTVQKSAQHYAPTTLYRDGALSPTLMQWDSPNSAGPHTALGRKLLDHADNGVTVLFFVRHSRKDERGFTAPYTLLGPARYLDHEGERPMAMRWRLQTPIPAWFLPEVRFVA